MKLTDNTILITGGATGIGLALASAFLERGNTVIICGRRESKLREAQASFPGLHTRVCDVSVREDCQSLYEWCVQEFPRLNVLVNNAGIQREVDFRKGTADLDEHSDEVEINLSGLIYLSALFVPHLMRQPAAALCQMSSGLALVPLAAAPIYCATKAAVHSLSRSLRHQLRDTSVQVFEILPPIVETDLDGGARERRGQTDRGISPEAVADQTLKGMDKDELEIAVGKVRALRIASRVVPGKMFGVMNK